MTYAVKIVFELLALVIAFSIRRVASGYPVTDGFPRRFAMRELLIVMTIAAILLGLAACGNK